MTTDSHTSGNGRRTLLTETLGRDGGRRVSAYLPSRPVEAILLAGDGQLLAPWGADLDRDDLPATMVVGAHRHEDETTRLHEYSPGFDPAVFAAHEEFLLHDVLPWARARSGADLPPARTAAYGVSAGGELALALGLRHPDLFGAVLCASPGAGFQPPPELSGRLPRTYLVAGRQEPFFLDNATRWSVALGDSGADVVLAERTGGHGDPFWRKELPTMVSWAFT